MSMVRDIRFWDKSSRKYAESAVADPNGYARTLERTRAHLLPRASVLEFGCGTGATALHLAGGVRSYLATDFSAGMIAIAKDKPAVRSIPRLFFRVATAEELVLRVDRFDVVLGFNFLHLVRDLPGTLRNIHELLKPGGLFISKTPCLEDMHPLLRLLLIPAMQAVGMAPHASAFGAAALEQRIGQAGFEILLVERHASNGKDNRPFIVACRR